MYVCTYIVYIKEVFLGVAALHRDLVLFFILRAIISSTLAKTTLCKKTNVSFQ